MRKLPPYLSFFCIIIGIAWLLLLPLNEYSRRTYVSENALLPGQVHTYFAGSDQNVFRGLKHEVDALAEEDNDMSVDYILWRSCQILTCIQRKRQARGHSQSLRAQSGTSEIRIHILRRKKCRREYLCHTSRTTRRCNGGNCACWGVEEYAGRAKP